MDAALAESSKQVFHMLEHVSQLAASLMQQQQGQPSAAASARLSAACWRVYALSVILGSSKSASDSFPQVGGVAHWVPLCMCTELRGFDVCGDTRGSGTVGMWVWCALSGLQAY